MTKNIGTSIQFLANSEGYHSPHSLRGGVTLSLSLLLGPGGRKRFGALIRPGLGHVNAT